MIEEEQIYFKAYHKKNKKRRNAQSRKCHKEARKAALIHYGGDPPSCSCCGEEHIEFLSIDHKNGDGAEHRRQIGSGGSGFYYWLKRNGYPFGYRVLCYNCNLSFGFSGYCPHEKEGKNAI